MSRFALVVLCVLAVIPGSARGQSPAIEPVHVAAGTVLTFHIQTRLRPIGGDALDAFPVGTVLRVKILNAVDSRVNGDGAEFRGSMVSSLALGNDVIVHPDAQVRGLLALLRSRSHPEGFRYELIVTGVTENGKAYALTAFLDPSLVDPGASAPPVARVAAKSN
ncbi:MAG TPA: hypothetical protein VLY23_02565 [Candidatus Acidoferrum sp.]|nr:hypothetical protein [Candidatus Acidoferrum sp.]